VAKLADEVELLSSTFADRLRRESVDLRRVAAYLELNLAKAVRLRHRLIKKALMASTP
jgi:hypothetical protein